MGESAEKLIRESRGSPHLSLWPSGPTTGAGKAPTGAVDATDAKGNPWGPAARIEGPTGGTGKWKLWPIDEQKHVLNQSVT